VGTPSPTPEPEPSPTPAPVADRAVAVAAIAPEQPGADDEAAPEIMVAQVAPDEVEADPDRPDAKTALEEAMRIASRSPIVRIDLAQAARRRRRPRVRRPLANDVDRGVTSLAGSGATGGPDGVRAAQREIELALARQGLIRRMPADPERPELLRLRAQMTPAGLRAFIRDIEAQGIVPKGTADAKWPAPTSSSAAALRSSARTTAAKPKIEIELVIELPR
jgi:hypothetical protein